MILNFRRYFHDDGYVKNFNQQQVKQEFNPGSMRSEVKYWLDNPYKNPNSSKSNNISQFEVKHYLLTLIGVSNGEEDWHTELFNRFTLHF